MTQNKRHKRDKNLRKVGNSYNNRPNRRGDPYLAIAEKQKKS